MYLPTYIVTDWFSPYEVKRGVYTDSFIDQIWICDKKVDSTQEQITFAPTAWPGWISENPHKTVLTPKYFYDECHTSIFSGISISSHQKLGLKN